jgi:hypothetical protein
MISVYFTPEQLLEIIHQLDKVENESANSLKNKLIETLKKYLDSFVEK